MSTPSVPAHLNFITGNKNKLAEVQAILAGVIELRNENIDLVEIQGTVEQVTSDKARRAAEAVRFAMSYYSVGTDPYMLISVSQINGPVLVEDTCLCFKAMNDLPGPYMYVPLPILHSMYPAHPNSLSK
jgi:inosine triphosphate pyrophosphatase